MLGVPSGWTIWQDLPLYPAGPVNALFQLPAQARFIHGHCFPVAFAQQLSGST